MVSGEKILDDSITNIPITARYNYLTDFTCFACKYPENVINTFKYLLM